MCLAWSVLLAMRTDWFLERAGYIFHAMKNSRKFCLNRQRLLTALVKCPPKIRRGPTSHITGFIEIMEFIVYLGHAE